MEQESFALESYALPWVKILNFNVKIGLLIAANCSRALEPEIVIHSEDDGTYAVRPIDG